MADDIPYEIDGTDFNVSAAKALAVEWENGWGEWKRELQSSGSSYFWADTPSGMLLAMAKADARAAHGWNARVVRVTDYPTV